jgi:hypothetical protein
MAMFEGIKDLIKKNWKEFARMGYNYLAKHLLDRVRIANPFYASLMEHGIVMGNQAVDKLTDNDPDNKRQLKDLVEENYVDLLSLTLAGAAQHLRPADRQKAILVLAETLQELQPTAPTS